METGIVTVEPVEAKAQLTRFAEIPFVLHHDDPRWSAGVRTRESWRLDSRRHPYFSTGDAAYLLGRRRGRPVGRIAAHLPEPGAAGRFGFFDAPDDAEVVDALIDAAGTWLAGQGCDSMTGPVSWTSGEEFGVIVAGADTPAVTGLAWTPRWYAERLAGAGGIAADHRATHVIRADECGLPTGTALTPGSKRDRPTHAGNYLDRSLVFSEVAAVPDVTRLLADASIRTAWRAARAARTRGFDTAVVVRCDGEPAQLVPPLIAAARDSGYTRVLAPWAPDDRMPVFEHQTFRFTL